MIQPSFKHGICILGVIPVRSEPSDRSEQVTQLLFGETFDVLDQTPKWAYIKATFDGYEGWVDLIQIRFISDEAFQKTIQSTPKYVTDFVEFVSDIKNKLTPITIGARIDILDIPEVNPNGIVYSGHLIEGKKTKESLIDVAQIFLNAPYQWGGRSPFGIDCSGFTQLIYKLNGHFIPRDASQQAQLGESLSFIEECEAGDLAFFDNEEGRITHVGMMLNDNYIIHASGSVRIDRIDFLGIFNQERNRHTHKLRVIKKII